MADKEIILIEDSQVISKGVNIIDNYVPFKSDADNLNFIGATITEEIDGTVTIVFTGGGGPGGGNLDFVGGPDTATITIDTGTAAVIPEATLIQAGVMAITQVQKLDDSITEVALTITPTASGVTFRTIDGIDIIMPLSTSSASGPISPTQHDLLNSALQGFDLSVTASPTELTINNPEGNDATIPDVTDTNKGAMYPALKADIDSAIQEVTTVGNVPVITTGTSVEIGEVEIPNSAPSYGVEDPDNNITTIEYVSASLYQLNQFFSNAGGSRFESIVKADLANPLTGGQDGAQIGLCVTGAFPNPDAGRYTIETVGDFDVIAKRSDFNAGDQVEFSKPEQDIIQVIGSIGGSAAAINANFVNGDNFPRFINGITPSDIQVDAVKQAGLNVTTAVDPLQLGVEEGSVINKFRNSFSFTAEDGVDAIFAYADGSGGWTISQEPAYTYGAAASTGGNAWDDGTGSLAEFVGNTQFKVDTVLGSTTDSSLVFIICGDTLYTNENDAKLAALSRRPNLGPWENSGLYAKALVVYQSIEAIINITQVTDGGGGGGTTSNIVNLSGEASTTTVTVSTDTGGTSVVINDATETEAGVQSAADKTQHNVNTADLVIINPKVDANELLSNANAVLIDKNSLHTVQDRLEWIATNGNSGSGYIANQTMTEVDTNYVLESWNVGATVSLTGGRVLPKIDIHSTGGYGFYGGGDTNSDPTDPNADLFVMYVPRGKSIEGLEISLTAAALSSGGDRFLVVSYADAATGGVIQPPAYGDDIWTSQTTMRDVSWTMNRDDVTYPNDGIYIYCSRQLIRDLNVIPADLTRKVKVLEDSSAIIYNGDAPNTGLVAVQSDGSILSTSQGGDIATIMKDAAIVVTDTSGTIQSVSSPIESYSGLPNSPPVLDTDYTDMTTTDPDGGTISSTIGTFVGAFLGSTYLGNPAARPAIGGVDSFVRSFSGLKSTSTVEFNLTIGNDGSIGATSQVTIIPTGFTDNSAVIANVSYQNETSISFDRVTTGSSVTFTIQCPDDSASGNGTRIRLESYLFTGRYGNDAPSPDPDALMTFVGDTAAKIVALESLSGLPIIRSNKSEYDNTLAISLGADVQAAIDAIVLSYGFGHYQGGPVPSGGLNNVIYNTIVQAPSGTTDLPVGAGASIVVTSCYNNSAFRNQKCIPVTGGVDVHVEFERKYANSVWGSWSRDISAQRVEYDNTATPALSAGNVQAAIVEMLNEHGGAGHTGQTQFITNANNVQANGLYSCQDTSAPSNFGILSHMQYDLTNAYQVYRDVTGSEEVRKWERRLDGTTWGTWQSLTQKFPLLIGFACFNPATMADDTTEIGYRARGNDLLTVFNSTTPGALSVTSTSGDYVDTDGRYDWKVNMVGIPATGSSKSEFQFEGSSGDTRILTHKQFSATGDITQTNYGTNSNSVITVELYQTY